MDSCLLEYATVFPIKNYVLIGYFSFLFWFSSAILLSKMKSLFLNLYTSPHGGFKLQSNDIKKHPSHIYCFWNCLSRNLLLIRLIIITLLWLLPKDLQKTLKTA